MEDAYVLMLEDGFNYEFIIMKVQYDEYLV